VRERLFGVPYRPFPINVAGRALINFVPQALSISMRIGLGIASSGKVVLVNRLIA
jgi:hypothetical protein